MTIPPRVFANLVEVWNNAVPGGVDCKTDENFCTTDKACDLVATKVAPVGF